MTTTTPGRLTGHPPRRRASPAGGALVLAGGAGDRGARCCRSSSCWSTRWARAGPRPSPTWCGRGCGSCCATRCRWSSSRPPPAPCWGSRAPGWSSAPACPGPAGGACCWSRPLAVPAFVNAYAWVSLRPAMTGLGGAVLITTLSYYPLVFLPVSAALRGLDRAWRTPPARWAWAGGAPSPASSCPSCGRRCSAAACWSRCTCSPSSASWPCCSSPPSPRRSSTSTRPPSTPARAACWRSCSSCSASPC